MTNRPIQHVIQTTFLFTLLLYCVVPGLANADEPSTAGNSFWGNWALEMPDGSAGWLTLSKSDGNPKGELWTVGGGKLLSEVLLDADTLTFTRKVRVGVPEYEGGSPTGDRIACRHSATVRGDAIRLVMDRPLANGKIDKLAFTGKRIPPIPARPDLSQVELGEPIELFNGRDLDGWMLTNPKQINGWKAMEGELVNTTPKLDFQPYSRYGNLRTKRKFMDFNLKIDFKVPPGGNSGIYLRGVYEAQVLDRDSKMQGIQGVGAIFGRIKPSENAGKLGNEWQTYDITLVDRHATVILNGKKVIDNQPIAGCTNGALQADETIPGPLYLQGDHTAVSYRNIILRPVLEGISDDNIKGDSAGDSEDELDDRSQTARKQERPNIVWIISDDLGPELGCYGYPDVATPNLDRLASKGARYTHAFSTAPVCSSSRTAFQTGQFQTTVGGHHHDTRDKPVLPDSIPTVTGLMQKAGYFVSNGHGTSTAEKRLAKSHFNFVYDARKFFDGYDWSQRAKGQPFFAQVQIKEPHRAFVKSDGPHPKAPIPPYYPDHPVTRADWANYLASIEALDKKVGAVLDRLEAEGLADNTLVMFFGDHGRPHVRGKQWLYDGGLRTPLVIRWPGKIRAGTVNNQLTSLLDLMPTTLAAAGVQAPNLPGANLLDTNRKGHEQLFAARDRCGDAPDRIRSVRTRDFKYIRNFHAELPYLQHSGYKKLQYPVETLMKVMHTQGRWDSPFMAETRPKEELYDLSADPYEMKNLAADPAHADKLAELRGAVDQWLNDSGDKGAIDEGESVDLEALKKEKWDWYEKSMKRRGLDPNLSDRAYLQWWKKELGVE